MKRFKFIFLSLLLFNISCGNSDKEILADLSVLMGDVSPSVGNSTTTFGFGIQYIAAETITLMASDVTVTGDSENCSVTVIETGDLVRRVEITGCTGDGSIGVSIASGTALDVLGNSVGAIEKTNIGVVDNTAPTITLNSINRDGGDSSTIFRFSLEYSDSGVGLSSSNLEVGSISFQGESTGCSTSIIGEALSDQVVEVSGCTGVGLMGISISSGVITDGASNLNIAFQPSRAVALGEVPSISAGEEHACVLSPDKSVRCWGVSTNGELGQGNTDTTGDESGELEFLPSIDLGTGRTAKAISAGENHTCAILDNDSVKCWGLNSSGQLGQDSTSTIGDASGEVSGLSSINLGTGRTAKAISAGENHTCAILDNDSVKCWGLNSSGQLGQDSTSTIGDASGEMATLTAINLGTSRTAKAVAAGENHTCAILDNDSVKCWGLNSSGQLGQDSTSNIGDASGEMAALTAINLGTSRTAKAIAAGANHTCSILDDDSVICWGLNSSGQLGQGDELNIGDAIDEMANLNPIDFGTNITAGSISTGRDHTCALLSDTTLKCWGGNTEGQLGQGNADSVGGSTNSSIAALGAINLGDAVVISSISAGAEYSCSVLEDYTIKCWGKNNSGQLGQGTVLSIGSAVGQMGDSLSPIPIRFSF